MSEPTISGIKVGDTITMPVTVNPPWWAFWRKPEVHIRSYIITRKSATGIYDAERHASYHSGVGY